MTIASYCIELIRDHGPLTADELGRSCRAAGVTRAQDPVVAVVNALRGAPGAVELDGTYHDVAAVLEGRCFTTRVPREPRAFDHGLDLAPLLEILDEPREVVGGGMVSRASGHYLRLDGVVLPRTESMFFRPVGGAVEICPVDLDAAALTRGERLADLIKAAPRDRWDGSWWAGTSTSDSLAVPRRLLRLLCADATLLREPATPLATLFPAPPPTDWPVRDGHRCVTVHVPDDVYADIERAAGLESVSSWLSVELARLARWPKGGWWTDPEDASDAWDEWDAADRVGLSGQLVAFPDRVRRSRPWPSGS